MYILFNLGNHWRSTI